jgi:hypothetical protein
MSRQNVMYDVNVDSLSCVSGEKKLSMSVSSGRLPSSERASMSGRCSRGCAIVSLLNGISKVQPHSYQCFTRTCSIDCTTRRDHSPVTVKDHSQQSILQVCLIGWHNRTYITARFSQDHQICPPDTHDLRSDGRVESLSCPWEPQTLSPSQLGLKHHQLRPSFPRTMQEPRLAVLVAWRLCRTIAPRSLSPLPAWKYGCSERLSR